MVKILRALRWILILTQGLRSRARLEAENLALRHQLNVVRRQVPQRLPLRNFDRFVFVWLYRLWPGVLTSMVIVKPETVVRWHRRGFKAFWRWKSRGAPGRPRIGKEMRDLTREVSLANPLWCAPRIHGELLKVGIEVAQSTAAKYMAKDRRPPSQSWKTFLSNHADGIGSIDFFLVSTAAFRLLFGLVTLRHDWRRLVHAAVITGRTADWIARQISEAFPWGNGAQLPHSRPRWRQRAGLQVTPRSHRDSRSTYDRPIDMATRARRATDRIEPTSSVWTI